MLSLDHLRFSSETPPGFIKQQEEELLAWKLEKYRLVSEGREVFEKKVVESLLREEAEGAGHMFLRRGEIWARDLTGAEARKADRSIAEGRRVVNVAFAGESGDADVVGCSGEVKVDMVLEEEMLGLDLCAEDEGVEGRCIVRWSRLV